MPAGFELYSPCGVLVTSITSRIPRIIGEISVTAAGSLSDAALSNGTPFYITIPNSDSSGNRALITASLSNSSGTWTLSWSFQNGNTSAYTILYGYY